MPCSRHYDILAKTRSRMTTATTFSRQNDVGSRARALLSTGDFKIQRRDGNENFA